MSIKVIEVEYSYSERRTYHTGHSRAEEARSRRETQLERLRSGEAERERLLAQARWLTRSQDASAEIRAILARVTSTSTPQSAEAGLGWNIQTKVLLGGIDIELKRREAERLVEEERLRKEREEAARQVAERTRREWEEEQARMREYHKELVQEAEQVFKTGDVGKFNILFLLDLEEWNLLSQDKFERLRRLVQSEERRRDRFDQLLEAHEDYADKLPEWRGGKRAFADMIINLCYNRYTYRKRHRSGYDPDRRGQWRRQARIASRH